MLQSYSLAAAICRTFLAVAGWVTLVLQYSMARSAGHAGGQDLALTTVNFFSYFTILTNILVAFSLSAAQLNPRSRLGAFFSRNSVQTAIAGNILVVACIYNLVLAGLWSPQGSAWVVDFFLHTAIPVLYLAYWVLFVPKGTVGFVAPLSWLLYPLLYLLYCLIRGGQMDWYPYPFVDVADLGYALVARNCSIIMIAFLAVFYGLTFLDRALGPKIAKTLTTADN